MMYAVLRHRYLATNKIKEFVCVDILTSCVASFGMALAIQ